MSVDKLVDSSQLDSDLTSVANAIRTKGGTSSQMSFPSGFVSAIENIHTGSTPTGTKEISITENGTTTEDVTDYAYAEIEVAVPASAVDSGTKNITANGTGQDVVGYAAVDVAVPNTYAAGDEGKVVSSGALVAQTSGSTSANGTVDTTLINSLSVSVPASAVVSGTLTVDSSGTKDVTNYQYASVPAGTAGTPTATKGTVSNHAVTVTPSVTNSAGWVGSETKTGTAVTVQASELDSGTKSITANGTNQDVVGYAAVDVAVPNSYSAGDEGKVVDDGALVSQTAHADVTPTTSDQTIDTTTNNSIKVKGDADLVAGNIKKDVEIFGVTGSYEGSGGGVDYNTLIDGSYSGRLETTVPFLRPYAIADMANVTSIYAADATICKTYGISTDSNLETVVIPKCNQINANGVRQNVKLKSLDFDGSGLASNTQIIGINAFLNCSELDTLVIRATSITGIMLSNINAFNSTKFASGAAGGTLYVPNSMISTYQSASNWSTILGYSTNSIKSIESTHTDPNAPIDLTLYYVDGTLIPTT